MINQHFNKPVTFQNYKTGRIISAPSTKIFCLKAGLGGNDRFHFTPVIQGKRFHFKGWGLIYNKKAILADIYGHEYKLDNLFVFSRKYELNINKLKQLIEGEIDFYNGIFLKGNYPDNIMCKPFNFEYVFTDGKKTLKGKICSRLENKIFGKQTGGFSRVLRGKRSKHKGWSIKKIIFKQKGKLLECHS